MFLSRFRADDGGVDKSPWSSFWFQSVPTNGSPHRITAEHAMRLTAVYRCVALLSGSFAMTPPRLYKIKTNGGRSYTTDHWLYKLLASRPNDMMNPVQYRGLMQAHMELRGQCYSRMYANSSGQVTDLVPMHPDRTSIEMLGEDNWRYKYKKRDGTEIILSRSQVFHRKDLTLDGIVGVNPIRAAAESLQMGLAAQAYGRRFFENNAVPNGWVELTRQFPDDEKRRTYRDQMQKSLSGRNQGKLAILELGAKFHEVSITNADAEVLASKKFSVEEVCRLYGVPPHKVGLLDRSTNNNIEQQALEYVQDAVLPRLAYWSAAIHFEFLEGTKDEDLRVEFSLSELLRADSKTRTAYYHGGITDGWMSRNQARIMEGMEPAPELDAYLQPLNMVEPGTEEDQPDTDATEDGQDAGNAQNPAQPDDGNENVDRPGAGSRRRAISPAKRDARLIALASAAAERIARKESQLVQKALKHADDAGALTVFYNEHADFVAAVLGISDGAAAAYCMKQLAFIKAAKDFRPNDFEVITRSRLERLAAGIEDKTS